MFCLQVEGPIVGAGGGGGGVRAVADPDLQIRGGAVIQSLRKRGAVSKKIFSAPVWSKNRGEGARAPPLDPSLGECYNR